MISLFSVLLSSSILSSLRMASDSVRPWEGEGVRQRREAGLKMEEMEGRSSRRILLWMAVLSLCCSALDRLKSNISVV